jgi:uncharacterized protein YkwD
MWQLLTSFELIFTVVTGVVLVTQTGLVTNKTNASLRAEAEYQAALIDTNTKTVQPPNSLTPSVEALPTPTLMATLTPEPTPTLTPKPTIRVEPTSEPVRPTPIPTRVSNSPTPQPTTLPPQATNSLVNAVNEHRKANGKGELSLRDDLCAFASDRAREIVSSFSHDGFQRRLSDGSFNSLHYSGIAENIFSGSSDVGSIVDGWKNSSGHNANMLGDYVWGCGKVEGDKAVFLLLR